ncbi:MAG: metallophosphoesterase [Pseudomonadota bacterium]
MTTRLFHISDVHFGVEDREALAVVADAVAREKPDAVVCTGDVTQRATHRQYAAAAEWFSALEAPVWIDPGNHDMPYRNLFERFTDPYRRYRKLAGKVAGSFESDDLVLVPLKSTVRAQGRFPWSDGVVTRKALERTLSRLDQLKGDPRVIVVTAHHPLLGPEDSGPNPTIGGNRAFAELVAAGADAFLSGHIHQPFDMQRERNGQSARMIGAGTLSTRLRHGEPPSYQVITIERGGKIDTELRRVGALVRQTSQAGS